jgi:hypothetical protein
LFLGSLRYAAHKPVHFKQKKRYPEKDAAFPGYNSTLPTVGAGFGRAGF